MPNLSSHVPVLVKEVLSALDPRPGGVYVDCTFGRGGHARELLKCVGAQGRILAIDRDPEAVAAGRLLESVNATASSGDRFTIKRASFTCLERFLTAQGICGKVDGAIFDLGVSSPQLDDAARGFSFRVDGPLDMRMDPDKGTSAAAWLRRASERHIAQVLKEYGEERYANRIARAIVRERKQGAIETTRRLADIVVQASPSRDRVRGSGTRREGTRRTRDGLYHRDKHPATRTFQAIRIFVNRELDELEEGLRQVIKVLAPGGRFAVISFHSLEDRVVKRFIRTHSRPTPPVQGLPMVYTPTSAPLRPVGGPVRPSKDEIARNPRARSAILRVAEKCP